jgi:hypothetical protein
MAKRGLVTAVPILMLIFVCPAGHAAMAESKSNPSAGQSTVNLDKYKHTQAEKDCTKARADRERCEGEANQCFYKFTVNEVVDQQNLKVIYPPSVWKETVWEEVPEPERHPEAEETYKNKYETYPYYSLRLKPTDRTVEAGRTYVFSRCPEDEFTLGSEIDPNQTGMPRGPEQSKR